MLYRILQSKIQISNRLKLIKMKRQKLILSLLSVTIIAGVYICFNSKRNKTSLKKINPITKNETDEFPNQWMDRQRCYPYKKIKLKSYLSGMEQAYKLRKKASKTRYNWELLGPTNIGGRITDIAINPETPSTIYVGGASGGILKTIDNGESWQNIFKDSPVISIGDIAIDPNNENIIYAGTGEANASSQSFFGDGIYKSNDAGLSWEHIGLDSSSYIARIIVDYSNSQRIFVAACGNLFTPGPERGIYRSDDGGLTWQKKLFITDSTSGIDIVQHPTNPNILYASMWERMRGLTYRRSTGESSGIYKSTDGGDTWVELTNGLPSGAYVGRIGLAIAKSNPDVLYASYDKGSSFMGVFKTTDGGDSWFETNDSELQSINSSYGWYFGQIRVDPTDENRVYVLGVELCRSDDGGDSWIWLYDNKNLIHVDHHAMYIDENTGRIVEGNDGGLYVSQNYGNNWTKINNLPLTQFYAIEIDNTNPYRIYGGTQDNSTIRTMTGALDDWDVILGGDGFYCLVDYTNQDIIYAESQWGNLCKSTDGGDYFYNINYQFYDDRTNWSSPLAMDPQNPQILYFGTYRIWKTTDGGSNWTAVSGDLTQGLASYGYSTITTIAISSINPNIVLVGSDDGRVNISEDAGNTWTDISEGLPNRWITRVAPDLFDTNTIYVTVSGFRWDEHEPHVLKSNDLGQNWNDISNNLPEIPTNCIALDPEIPNRIFVGTDAGVFYSQNGGENWCDISEGIPNVAIIDMKINRNTRTLVIGTYGCSAYKIDLDDINVGVYEKTLSDTQIELSQNYPNPFRDETTITFTLINNTKINLSIYNIEGRKIKTLKQGFLYKGIHIIKWNGKDENGRRISKGTYFYQLKTSDKRIIKKMILM